jgi:hypothetical protein
LPSSLPATANFAGGADRASTSTAGRRCSSRPRCRARGCSRRSRREHVVEAAEADVVGPAVAADDPHALLHEVVVEPARARGRRGPSTPASLRAARDALALGGDARLVVAGRPREQRRRELVAERAAERRRSSRAARRARRRARRMPEAELGVVLEERVGPGRAAALGVWCTASSAGCRRRSTSSRWRWR